MRFWSPLLPCIATIWRFALGKVVEWHVFFERIEKGLSSWGGRRGTELFNWRVACMAGVRGGMPRFGVFLAVRGFCRRHCTLQGRYGVAGDDVSIGFCFDGDAVVYYAGV